MRRNDENGRFDEAEERPSFERGFDVPLDSRGLYPWALEENLRVLNGILFGSMLKRMYSYNILPFEPARCRKK